MVAEVIVKVAFCAAKHYRHSLKGVCPWDLCSRKSNDATIVRNTDIRGAIPGMH